LPSANNNNYYYYQQQEPLLSKNQDLLKTIASKVYLRFKSTAPQKSTPSARQAEDSALYCSQVDVEDSCESGSTAEVSS
jgi:hypothetical protein